MTLSPGQENDICRAPDLLAEHVAKYVIADKAYDSDALIAAIEQKGGTAVIPRRAGRTVPRGLLRTQYRRRNQVERFVNRLKHFRRIATRYEKTARNFLGFIQLAAVLVWVS